MTAPYDPVQAVRDALQDAGCHVQAAGRDRYTAQCPAHEDRDPSLSLARGSHGEPKAVVHCHAGCPVADVLSALGLEPAALFADYVPAPVGSVSYLPHVRAWKPPSEQRPRPAPYRREKVAHYDYVWPDGSPCARVVKYHKVDPDTGEVTGKTFTQQRWDVEQRTYLSGLDGLDVPLYHADRVQAAIRRGEPILVCEGEKDADNATAAWGITATCNPMGAGSWRPHHTEALAGAVVIVCADNDPAGRAHARQVRDELANLATTHLRMPAGGNDLSDHIGAGHGLGDLLEIPQDDPAGGDPGEAELGGEDAPNPDEQEWLYRQAVERKAAELQLLEDARHLLATAKAGQAPPLTATALDAFLAEPDEDVAYRVQDLWPKDGRVLLAAAAKAGKTTLTVNLLRGLADGGTFLGYDVAQVTGTVAYFNLEVSARQMRTWLRQAGVRHADRIHVVNLRGQISALTLSSEQGRQRVADWLAGLDVEVVVLDPLAPLLASLGLEENSNTDVATFFGWWSEMLNRAGVADDLICHHAGHAAGRSRGASRLMDEPDALWTITRDTGGEDDQDDIYAGLEPRFFRAFGRDVEVAEQPLIFDPASRLLSLGQGNRRQIRAAAKRDRAEQVIRERLARGSATQNEITRKSGLNYQEAKDTLDALVEEGTVERSRAGQAYVYALNRHLTPTDTKPLVSVTDTTPYRGVGTETSHQTDTDTKARACQTCGTPTEHHGYRYCSDCERRARRGADA